MSDDDIPNTPDEYELTRAGLRWLKERSKRLAAEKERDSWREEALSHRRRLGIPVPGTGKRPKPGDLKKALKDAIQTTDPASGSDEEKEISVSKKDINAQPVDGGRLGPAEPTVRNATMPELPATRAGEDTGVNPLGVYATDVDPLGAYASSRNANQDALKNGKGKK